MVVYKLSNTVRNKILNYKDTVDSIFIDEEVSFSTNCSTCDCQNSPFCDPDHQHIITGDLRIVSNQKLCKLLSKGPNYREKRTLNFSKCVKNISQALEDCINNLSHKYKLNKENFANWKRQIIDQILAKVRTLKANVVPHKTKSMLDDVTVKTYLCDLHEKFVIVPIDKAANNYAFICKKYYIAKLMKEVGMPDNSSETYKVSDLNKEVIIQNNVEFCAKYNFKVSDEQKTLPIIYWIPKMHKTPIGSRFIVASSKCSTKPLSKAVSKAFKLIFEQVKNFHDKSTFYSNYKKFWAVNNSFPVIEKLTKINEKKNAKSISTFDFSTLYTKIKHQNLLNTLYEIIDFVFSGGT